MLRERVADGEEDTRRCEFTVCDIPALCGASKRVLPQTRLHPRFPALNQSAKALGRLAPAALRGP